MYSSPTTSPKHKSGTPRVSLAKTKPRWLDFWQRTQIHPTLARHSIMHLHHLNPTFPYPRTFTLTHPSHPLRFVSQNRAPATRFLVGGPNPPRRRLFPTSQPLDHSVSHSISVPSIEIEHPPRLVGSEPNTPPWRSLFQWEVLQARMGSARQIKPTVQTPGQHREHVHALEEVGDERRASVRKRRRGSTAQLRNTPWVYDIFVFVGRETIGGKRAGKRIRMNKR